MKNRNKNYFTAQKQYAIVQETNDNKIDQDFPGFPHGHAAENVIHPRNETDRKTADVDNKDGEKINRETAEEKSDGSAGAFSATEQVRE